MSSDLLAKLRAWVSRNREVQHPRQTGDYQKVFDSVDEVRAILGEIMSGVNAAASVFKSASRSPSPETAAAARGVVDELGSYSEIRRELNSVKSMFSSGVLGDLNKSKARMILHMVHYLERADFTPEQVAKLREMSSVSHAGSSDFPEEVNQSGLDNLLRNSIYNLSGGADKTLKVIRELLQNAVDATDPKQHPELTSREGFSPEIHIDSDSFWVTEDGKRNVLLDLVVEDRGVGMDWETLSRKFFVTFDSGKNSDKGAAGGFGIAKALIQDAPKHGWSVDTRGIHSSRFGKNVFFGTRRDAQYKAPASEIRKSSDGTTLTLHGLPYAAESSIKNLCSVYAINGRVKIFYKGEEQVPRFTMDSADLKPLSRAGDVSDIMADDESERDAVGRVFDKFKGDIQDKIEEVGMTSGGKTSYKFYLKKRSGGETGKLYVTVNGQYQFDRDEFIPKTDIVCAVDTTARPGDDDYPLDPGREYLRGDINTKIKELIGVIRQFAQKVAEDDLFKDGIEMINVNEDAEPMVVDESESTTSKEDMMLHALQHITGASGFKEPEEDGSNAVPTQSRPPVDTDRFGDSEVDTRRGSDGGGVSDDVPSGGGGSGGEGGSGGGEGSNIEKVTNDLFNLAGPNSFYSKEAIRELVQDAASSDPVEQNKKIRSIIEGLSTPAQILIQKNFVARPVIQDNSRILGEMMILWQKAMKLIMQKVASTTRYSFSRGRRFVPGVIFSDEVLGLYMPAKKDAGRPHDSVSINPVTLAAFILPKDFAERVADEGGEKDAFDMVSDSDRSTSEDTPINRVAKFVFHLAVHEMCHLIYPDFRDTGSEQFHRNISKMELICHDVYEEIRREVRQRMPKLRKAARRLITIVAKHKASKIKEWAVGFREWSSRRPSFSEMPMPRLGSSVRTRPGTFREFLEGG